MTKVCKNLENMKNIDKNWYKCEYYGIYTKRGISILEWRKIMDLLIKMWKID